MPSKSFSSKTLSVPSGAWDTHLHVTDPARFPPPPGAKAEYAPRPATLADCVSITRSLGLTRLCFVQTSTYGTDNAWISACLAECGGREGRARGVVVFDPDTTSDEQLREWHAQGVRGARVNLVSVSKSLSEEELASTLRRYADRIRPLGGWSLQLYVKLAVIPQLLPLVDGLGVSLVIDHIGSPPSLKTPMAQHAGWKELLALLEDERVFVKIGAPYRFTKDPEFRDMEAPVRELMRTRGGRAAVFESDWPHTRFEETEIAPFVTRCLEWCDGDEELAEKVFRTNAERMLDV